MEISEEVRSAYIGLRARTDDNSDLTSFGRLLKNAADAIRDTLAEAMRLEWELKLHNGISDREYTERHNWQQADWQQAAHAFILGEKHD